MPLYEYHCLKCGKTTERIQKFSDRPLTVCPHCAGKLEKLISSPAIRFKGSGWYVTDYGKHRSAESTNKTESSAPKPSKPSPESKPKETTKA